jgi:uncharacterized protein (DUF2141 family)
MFKSLLPSLTAVGSLAIVSSMSLTQSAMAVTWVKVTENAAKTDFFIDTDSIKKKKGQTVSYWEYREL